MRLLVKSTQVFERKIVAKTGKQYTFREQEAVIDIGEERRVIVLSLDDSQVAYTPGQYDVGDASFEVDRNRNLTLKRRLALKPVTSAASVAVAGRPG